MTKTKRLLSLLVVVIMVLSVLSGFSITASAAGAADSATKEAAETDALIYSAFSPLTSSPGYGKSVPSGLIFVCSEWAKTTGTGDNVKPVYADGTTVYMDFGGEVYKAVKGTNAFGTINEVLEKVARNNIKIKVGPGKYVEDVTLSNSGMCFYGNYAGVNPNVDTEFVYKKDLNPVRDPALESEISASQWTWTTSSNNINIDGFKITGEDTSKDFDIAVSGAYSEYMGMYNCIVENCSRLMDANRGYSTGVYFKNNRVVNCSGGGNSDGILVGGGAMCDVMMDHNYFENCSIYGSYYTACGLSDSETLISFSYNVLYECAKGVNFDYNNANFGANLDYKKVVGNIFYGGGSADKTLIKAKYWLDVVKDSNTIACTDTSSKTFISNNEFYNLAAGVHAIDLVGRDSLLGNTGNYIVSVTNNKFIYEASVKEPDKAVRSNIMGTVDASYNFFGRYNENGEIVPLTATDYTGYVDAATSIITKPYYMDFEMTRVSGGVALSVAQDRVLVNLGFDTVGHKNSSLVVDNENAKIVAYAKEGNESLLFERKASASVTQYALSANNTTLQIYTDYLLTKPVRNMEVDLTGDVTRLFLVAVDKLSNQATKYDLIINTTTDKTKKEIRYLIDDTNNKPYSNYTVSDFNIDVNLESKYVYFPFSLVVSPSATYKIYTDKNLTKEYADETYYMEPDKDIVLYAKITAGNGEYDVYTLNIRREGLPSTDAKILNALSPEQDILVFNTRRTIVYRPRALVEGATFDFIVSPNASYKIYKNYDENTGKLTELVSTQAEPKELPITDAINYYYVEVKSDFGMSQVYTLSIYNDVKSDDNVITGITGLGPDVVQIIDNVIYIQASSTVTAVNAHFEVNPFADVTVYVDEEKTYKVTPAHTFETINNREVEIRTFQLGITSRVSYYYMNVISETGRLNEYEIVVTKEATANSFTDIKDHWAAEYINQIADYGIITGYYDAEKDVYTFAPNNFVTRQEVATMFCRMMGIDQLSFKNDILSDVFADANDIPDWSYNYVKGAYFLKFMVGSENEKGDLVFKPTAKITRQEIFQAIANILDLDKDAAKNVDLSKYKDAKDVAGWATPATKAVIKAGIIEGDSNGKLNPKSNVTRAELAKIIALTNTISESL